MLASGQITEAIAARITGLALGAAVATDRAWPWAENQLPAWRVIEADEDIEPLTIHRPPRQQHALKIELRGSVRATDELDDSLRALVAEALTAVFDTTTPPADALAGLAPKVQLSARRIERGMSTEGQAAVGQAVITLLAKFRTEPNAPEILV